MQNKCAVITGGSSGLGFAFAKKLSEQGYISVIIARRKDKLDGAVSKIRDLGYDCVGFCGDVASEEDMTTILSKVKQRFINIDFLVLNAGVVNVGLLADYGDYNILKEDIEIDLWGTVLATKTFLPLLKPYSRILIISSAMGLVGVAGYSTYCAAKAGVVTFAEALRRELLSRKISVYVACPGDIDTPQYEAERRRMPDWMSKPTPGRRKVMSSETAAERILDKCEGNSFLITINFEVALLHFLRGILPSRLADSILDYSLPRPR